MLVGAVEPITEIGGRLVGCLSVEGHHRRRYARNSRDDGAPTFFRDPSHLDEVTPAANDSFKMMSHDVMNLACSEL
jgi:hypothetical protein